MRKAAAVLIATPWFLVAGSALWLRRRRRDRGERTPPGSISA